VDAEGLMATACDIKNAKFDDADLGYWSGGAHRGVMTNSISDCPFQFNQDSAHMMNIGAFIPGRPSMGSWV
jgi:hypothetical protein